MLLNQLASSCDDVIMHLSPEERVVMFLFIDFIKKHFTAINLIGEGTGKLLSDFRTVTLFFHNKTPLLWNSHFSRSHVMQSV